MRRIIVDCEASGLHTESYPIQIAWLDLDSDAAGSFYICPHDTWTHWDYNAQDIHNLTQQFLRDVGLSVEQSATILGEMAKDTVILSDAPAFELFWLERLLDASEHSQGVGLQVQSVFAACDNLEHAQRMATIMQTQERTHDALDDCRAIKQALIDSKE